MGGPAVALAPVNAGQHIVAMLTRTVCAALDAVPCSIRKLAAASGVQPSTLTRIRQGDRPATPATADRLAEALEEWADLCTTHARAIRRAIREAP